MRVSRVGWVGLAVLPVAAFTFQAISSLNVTKPGYVSLSVDIADFNRDGVADVVSGNDPKPDLLPLPPSTIAVQFGTRAGLNTGPITELGVIGSPVQVLAGDFTGDGNPDIASLVQIPGAATDPMRICVYAGNGFGAFAAPVCSAIAGLPQRMAAGDFNRDGLLDLVVSRAADSTVLMMINRGGGSFTAGASISVALPVAMAVADFNGDSVADAAIVSQSGSLVLWLSQAGGASQVQQTYPIAAGASEILALDLNRDGRTDLAVGYGSASVVTTAFGQAGGGLGPLTDTRLPAPLLSMRAVDLNGDLFPEIVAMTAFGLVAMPVGADGAIGSPSLPGVGPVSVRPIAVGDLNGDLRPDIVSVTLNGPVALLGQASATVTKIQVTPGGTALAGRPVSISISVQLATPGTTVVPLVGAIVQVLDAGRELQRLTLTTGSGADLASGKVDIVLPAGSRELSARFLGTASYLTSTSDVVPVTVQLAQSTVQFRTGPMDVSYTQGLRVGVIVFGPLSLANEGLVRLSVNGREVAQGLVSNGATEVFIPPSIALGKIRVRASYEGPNYLPSSTDEIDYFVKGGTAAGSSAASYRPTVAPDSFVYLKVPGLLRTASATAVPWPQTLGAVEVETRDTAGGTRVKAGLAYVGPDQINLQLPASTPTGVRRLVVSVDGVEAATGELQVATLAPGIFTAAGSGSGAPAALASRYQADGTVVPQSVFVCSPEVCLPAVMDLGGLGDSLIVSLFGTGLRLAKSVTATVDGRPADVLFAGAQPEVPGLDQINLKVPRDVAGRGEVSLVVFADGIASNGVRIAVR